MCCIDRLTVQPPQPKRSCTHHQLHISNPSRQPTHFSLCWPRGGKHKISNIHYPMPVTVTETIYELGKGNSALMDQPLDLLCVANCSLLINCGQCEGIN